MSESLKWKNHLIASSFPLEYEVAKMLVDHGFFIESDYTYKRKNEKGFKCDFSTDIYATGFSPFEDKNKIECKYRRESKWLFLEDVNTDDFSDVTIGNTIKETDDFSKYKMKKESNQDFEKELYYGYKCIEIKQDKVFDKEFKHGISQLQYAMAQLYKDSIRNELTNNDEENKPFVNIGILLTTADLFIANDDFSIQMVESSKSIEEMATKVPYLGFYTNLTPDFSEHCQSIFMDLLEFTYTPEDCSSKCTDLIEGQTWELRKNFTQFLVCNKEAFPELLRKIVQIVEDDTMN
jgi:hypothetical protein